MLESSRKLLVRNTGQYLLVDPQDWELVKGISWRLVDGVIEAPNGLTYEEVCNFPLDTKNRYGYIYSKIRKHLIPKDKSWEFSEFHGKFILK
jgi:hypothetical protein